MQFIFIYMKLCACHFGWRGATTTLPTFDCGLLFTPSLIIIPPSPLLLLLFGVIISTCMHFLVVASASSFSSFKGRFRGCQGPFASLNGPYHNSFYALALSGASEPSSSLPMVIIEWENGSILCTSLLLFLFSYHIRVSPIKTNFEVKPSDHQRRCR